MKKNDIQLIPSYWASVSGGKDSLFMLKLILSQRDRYPLDGVVHFELEIDYPFIKDVVDFMESECKNYNIPFVRIRPRRSWEEIYYTQLPNGNYYGFPTRKARWCNSMYKLDCFKQLTEFLQSRGRSVVSYIGYCVDEPERYKKRNVSEIYPLVENGIYETSILQWSKTVPLFNNYYLSNRRCGCMYCPLSDYVKFAYLYKYYPDNFKYMIEKMRETERMRSVELGRPFSCIQSNPKYNADYLEHIVKTRYLNELEYLEHNEQLTLF